MPRVREPELTDDPAIAAADHLHALSALGRINAFSRTAARLADGVRRVARGRATAAPLVVIDVACGGGDVTIDLARRLSHRGGGVTVEVIGIDFSQRAIERAIQLAARRGSRVGFAERDVISAGCPPCDVAVSSLFLHHLDDADAIGLLHAMASAARCGIVVSDLIRSRSGLLLAHLATMVLTRSRVARVDGPLSVRAARTVTEYRALLASAGLGGATVRRVWPERVVIVWRAVGKEP